MTGDFYCEEALSGCTPIDKITETAHVLAFHHTRPRWLPSIVRLNIWLILAVTSLLSARLFILIYNHAVNILYWDQWGFFDPLFEGRRWWTLFRWQHGPWRQGAGILSYWLAEVTRWDSRIESFAIGGIVWLAMVAALWLKRRLFGELTAYDLTIPLIVLTTAQFQTFTGPVSMAPTALPLLLIILYCLAWTIRRRWLRNTLALFLNLLLVNTGYGLLIGGLTPGLFALECWKHRADRRYLVGIFGALLLSVLTIIWFVSDYDYGHLNNSTQQRPSFWHYPLFACLMFGRFVRPNTEHIAWHTYVAMLFGIGLFGLSLYALLRQLRQMIAAEFAEHLVELTVVILLGYELLFTLSTALGRAGAGLNGSQSSRFMTLIPGVLGLYFYLLTLESLRVRQGMLAIFLVLLLPGHFPLGLGINHPANYFSVNKRNWKDCYLRYEDVEKCDALPDLRTDFRLGAAKWKLDYLKRNKLNLYLDSP